jgi:hypothetical protein
VIDDDDDKLVTRAEMRGLWIQSDAARDGLQSVAHAQIKTNLKIDDIRKTLAVMQILVAMPTVIATFVLLRVLWILRGTIFEDAQAFLAMVVP